MGDTAIKVDGVWKKFRKGELYDSLRELLPAMASRVFHPRRKKQDELIAREFWALRDVSFTVKHGQSLGIIGPTTQNSLALPVAIHRRRRRPASGTRRKDKRCALT